MKFLSTIASLARPRGVKSACAECPDGLPGEDVHFSAAVTALGAKLAKADGQAQPLEFIAFSEVFQPGPHAARDVRRLYDLARQTTHGYESYARQIGRRYGRCPGLLEDVLGGLFHVAKADGVVTPQELAFLERVSELFGLSPLTFRRIRAAQLGAAADDPYVVLGVEPDVPDAAVHAAWKAALLQAHPDRTASLGLPSEYVQAAHERSAAINAAYDQVMRERHDLVAAEPA